MSGVPISVEVLDLTQLISGKSKENFEKYAPEF